ncbi:putative pectinesterase/pectinesterase inhibitor 34 [Wolffia australiana]
MNYGKLGVADSIPSASDLPFERDRQRRREDGSYRCVLVWATVFMIAGGAAAAAYLFIEPGGRTAAASEPTLHHSSRAISRACDVTRFPSLCVRTLASSPKTAEMNLVHVSVNVTLQRVSQTLYGVSAIVNSSMDVRLRAAYEDCVELLDDSVHHLSRSLAAVEPGGAPGGDSYADVLTWLSGALTNHDTCAEGLGGASDGPVKDQMLAHLSDLSEMVSNSLAMFAAASKSKSVAGVRRGRRLMSSGAAGDFPPWMSRKDRRLLQAPASAIPADIVVSKDGNGTFRTIEEAVKAAPEFSPRRFIIYIKAGRYDENIKIGLKKTNLMFVGEGKSYTIISGARSVYDNFTTFHTATFATTGAGFIARDITFQNWAGPEKHQAVALRIGADHAVVYRCNVIGYQDTLYVHSQRQFFRECDIYGTVDFIFGNAAVVLQNCSIYARRPLGLQKNTITAQNRKDPNQNTGISIHASRILATPDLNATKAQFSTYLGRPWKLYSRTVIMMSYIADHVHPAGWLEWNSTFALDTLYYGEYMNYGPGAALANRVSWPGFRVIALPLEAAKFTVSQFIYGSSWLPSTGVAFLAGLST